MLLYVPAPLKVALVEAWLLPFTATLEEAKLTPAGPEKLTVPQVGLRAPVAVTVAVRVTVCPKTDGLTLGESAVEVFALTVSGWVSELLRKFASALPPL